MPSDVLLTSLSNVLEDSPIYSSSHSTVTPVSVNDSTHLLDRILIFWSHQEVLDGIASFKVDMHPMFAVYFLQDLTHPFVVWDHHVWFLVVVVTRICGISSIFVVIWTFVLIFTPFRPKQDICIFGVLFVDTVLPVATAENWNIWFDLCDGGYQLHYIWMTLCDGCPTANKGQYELVSCILLYVDFHLH